MSFSSWLNNVVFWKYDKVELTSQVEGYNSLLKFKTYRGNASAIYFIISLSYYLIFKDSLSLIIFILTTFLCIFVFKGYRSAMYGVLIVFLLHSLYRAVQLEKLLPLFPLLFILKPIVLAIRVENRKYKRVKLTYKKLIIFAILFILIVVAGIDFYKYYKEQTTSLKSDKEFTDKSKSTSLVKEYDLANQKGNSKETDSKTKIFTPKEVINANRNYIVKVICTDDTSIYSGSGVLIGQIGGDPAVITNFHVIENVIGKSNPDISIPMCSITAGGSEWGEVYYAEIYTGESKELISDMKTTDYAILKILKKPEIITTDYDSGEVQKRTHNFFNLHNYPSVCVQPDISIGDSVLVLGYPIISKPQIQGFGNMADFTATEGIISQNVKNNDWYFGVSAKIDQGNSGGGAFLVNQNCLLGIPTYANRGEIESLGFVLNYNRLYVQMLTDILDK